MKIYKICELGHTITGTTPSTKNKEYYKEPIYIFAGPSDISKSRYILNSEKYISELAYRDYQNRFINENDIAVSCIGYLGYVSIAKEKMLTNQQINSICNIKQDVALPLYLYYKLVTMQKYFKSIGGNGTALPIINKTLFDSVKLNIHELSEQQHIVNILGTIDDKIENNEKIYRKIEHELQLIYSKYLSKNNIDKNKYNYIPLKDISEFIGGYSYKGNELVKSKCGMITIKNFDRNGGFKLDGFKDLSENNSAKPAQYVDLYDIVVAHTDLTQNAEIIGNAEIVLNKKNYEKLIASMDIVIVRPKEINNNLLYLLLHNQDFKKHALGYCAGTTVLHLNKKALQEYKVYIPKENKLLERISKTIGLLITKQSQLIIKNQRLTELKQLYLKKFFD